MLCNKCIYTKKKHSHVISLTQLIYLLTHCHALSLHPSLSPITLIHPLPHTHTLLLQSLTVTHSLVHTCSLTQICLCASYAVSTVWSKHWCVKVIDKIVPVHTLTAYLGLELIVPLTPKLGTRWRGAVSFMPW